MSSKRDRDTAMRQWLAVIYERHSEDVYGVIRSRLRVLGLDPAAADDLVQDVFMTAMGKCETLISHPDIRRWLFATAQYKCKNYCRVQASARRHTLFSIDSEVATEVQDPRAERALEAALDSQVDDESVLMAIKEGMTVSEHLLFQQVYEEKIPAKQLAEIYGITEAAVSMRISRVRKRIRNILNNLLLILLIHG